MSREKAADHCLTALPLWDEKKLDTYFLDKARDLSPSPIRELIERVGGVSGFFDPSRFQVVYGQVVREPITLAMVCKSINRYKAYEPSPWDGELVKDIVGNEWEMADCGDPDWVVLDDQGFLRLNPVLSSHLDEKNKTILRSEARDQYEIAYVIDRLCQVINVRLGLERSLKGLSVLESIDYEIETKGLADYFKTVTFRINNLKGELDTLSQTLFELKPLEDYLETMGEFDQTLSRFHQHLETLRGIENRFATLDMELEVDLEPFHALKYGVNEHLQGVNHLNALLGTLTKKEVREGLLTQLPKLNDRYTVILNDTQRIDYYQRLNNPEKAIKQEISEQRGRLKHRLETLKWAKVSVDDKAKTLSACERLFETLKNNPQGMRLEEIDQVFLDPDVYHADLKDLQGQVLGYLAYLTEEFATLEKRMKAYFPQECPEWTSRLKRLEKNLSIVHAYGALLNDDDRGASQKIHALEKRFKQDEETLAKVKRGDLNKETHFFLKRIKKTLREKKNKRGCHEGLVAFEQTCRKLRFETDMLTKRELNQTALRQLSSRIEGLTIERQTQYYEDLARDKDSLGDAMSLGFYCKEKLLTPKASLLSKVQFQIQDNERHLVLDHIQRGVKRLEETLIFMLEDPSSGQLLEKNLTCERDSMAAFLQTISSGLSNLEVEIAYRKYEQFSSLVMSLIALRVQVIELSSDAPDLSRLRALKGQWSDLKKQFAGVALEPEQVKMLGHLIDQVGIQIDALGGIRLENLSRIHRDLKTHAKENVSPQLSGIDEVLHLKHHLSFPLNPENRLLGTPLHQALEAVSQAKAESLSPELQVQQEALSLIFNLELALKDLLTLHATQDSILTLTVELNAHKEALMGHYNAYLAGERESTTLAAATCQQVQALVDLYKTQIDDPLSAYQQANAPKAAQGFLDFLMQCLTSLRQSLFGKTREEKSREADYAKTVSQYEEAKNSQVAFAPCFFKPGEGKKEPMVVLAETTVLTI